MAKKDLLLNLIQSLSANEKRYFALFNPGTTGSQNYRKIFKVLETETSYDSGTIMKKLGPSSMNIAYEKSYLQKMLLRSLRNFYDESTDELTLHSTFINIEVLFNKQQYELCIDMIRQSRKLAAKGERFQLELLLIQWEKRCILRLGDYDYLEKQFTRGLKDELHIISLLGNFSQYRSLQLYMISTIYGKGNVRRKADQKKLNDIIRYPLMKSVKLAKSFRAKLLYYEILFSWHHHNYNIEKAYYYNQLGLKLFDNTPGGIENNTQSYFSFLANLFNRALALNKMAELGSIVTRIENFAVDYKHKLPSSLEKEIRTFIIEQKMIMYTYNREYQKSLNLAEAVLLEVEKPRAGLRPAFYIVFYYFTALSCFYLKQYEKSLTYSRKIIDGFDNKVRIDFVFITQLLHFLTHFELGHVELLPYLHKSIQRFAQAHDLRNPATDLVVKFFLALAKNNGDKINARTLIQQYHDLLLPFKEDTTQNIVIETLDLFNWMEQKLKKH